MKAIKYILLGLSVCVFCSGHAQNNNKAQKIRKSGNGWVSIGPSNISGRTLSLWIDKNNSQKLYAGAAGSGLWISTNGGASWVRNVAYSGSSAVSAIVQDNEGNIYVGTGDGLIQSSSGFAEPKVENAYNNYGIKGDGIHKSTDGGATFTLLTSTSDWDEINGMAFDFDNNKLYVATSGGLKVSADGGATFQDAHIGNSMKCIEVHVGEGNMVAYSNFEGNSGARAYLSTDGGTTFTSLCGTNKLPTNAGRISLAISPTNSNMMYALVASTTGAFQGVYQSRNKGVTWRSISAVGGLTDLIGGTNGMNCNRIIVDQTDSSKIILGGMAVFMGQEYDSTQNYSWKNISSNAYMYNIVAKDSDIYICSQKGILKSTNAGASFKEQNNNFTSMQSYTLAVANDGRFMTGIRNGGIAYINNPHNTLKRAVEISTPAGDAGNAIFSLIKTETMFYTGYYGFCYRRASENSDPQTPQEWYGLNSANSSIMASGASQTRWHPSQNNLTTNYASARVTPLAVWESYNDQNSIDSVQYIVDKTYAQGDQICIKSARNNYPIFYTYNGIDTLRRNEDTLTVQDIVTFRLFMGGAAHKIGGNSVGAPVFMTTTGLDYFNLPSWNCVFRTKDSTEQVMDLKVSEDGDHLFVLTRRYLSGYIYAIYRVSGFDTYRTPEEIDVCEYIVDPTKGFTSDNPQRMLTDNLLIDNYSGVDITSITLDPQDNNTLIFTTNGDGLAFQRVFAITDALTATNGNATIEDKEGTGLPEDISVYTSIVEMDNSNIALLGTEEGVYISKNFSSATPTWELYNNGINVKVPVFNLFQQTKRWPDTRSVSYSADGTPTYVDFPGVSNYGSIYAATHGLGVFIDSTYFNAIDNPKNNSKNQDNVNIAIYPNPTNQNAIVAFDVKENSDVIVQVVDITGRVIRTENKGRLSEGYYQEYLDCSALSNGMYFVAININKKVHTVKLVVNK